MCAIKQSCKKAVGGGVCVSVYFEPRKSVRESEKPPAAADPRSQRLSKRAPASPADHLKGSLCKRSWTRTTTNNTLVSFKNTFFIARGRAQRNHFTRFLTKGDKHVFAAS